MSFDIIFQNALALHEAGRLDEAEAAYRRLLETAPEHTDLLHLLGMTATQKGAFEAGIPHLYKAVKLAPDVIAYKFTLACALQNAGRMNEALEYYNDILKKDESMPDTYNNMGDIYMRKGDAVKAETFFLKALEKQADFAPALINLGVLKRNADETEKAMDYFEKAIESAPDMPDGFAQKALTLRQAERYEEALTFYDRALALEPENIVVLNGKGIALEALERYEDALACYCEAIALNPRFADAYNNRANVYVKLGKKWDAEDDFKYAVKIDPSYAEAYNNLGALLFAEERYEESLECYRKAFLINEHSAEAMNNLAMAVKAAGDCEEAVALLFNALVTNPSQKTIQHNLAAALYELHTHENKPEDAGKLAEKWAEKYPDHIIARHLCASFKGEIPNGEDSAYVRELFDAFADTFDDTLEKIGYRIPDLMAEAMEKHRPDGKKFGHVLDAGCGTGLCGVKIRPYAEKLTGADLSEKMIRRAREKSVYDSLETAEIRDYLQKNAETFDCVVMGDVACYFSDLAPLLSDVFTALKPDGFLFFTIQEHSGGQACVLQPSGRYAHNCDKLKELVLKQGFEITAADKTVLRMENGKEVAGVFFSVKK